MAPKFGLFGLWLCFAWTNQAFRSISHGNMSDSVSELISNATVKASSEIKYFIAGDDDANECPSGSSKVTTSQECNEFQRQNGRAYDGTQRSPDVPGGCYQTSNEEFSRKIFFNHEKGRGKEGMFPICKVAPDEIIFEVSCDKPKPWRPRPCSLVGFCWGEAAYVKSTGCRNYVEGENFQGCVGMKKDHNRLTNKAELLACKTQHMCCTHGWDSCTWFDQACIQKCRKEFKQCKEQIDA